MVLPFSASYTQIVYCGNFRGGKEEIFRNVELLHG